MKQSLELDQKDIETAIRYYIQQRYCIPVEFVTIYQYKADSAGPSEYDYITATVNTSVVDPTVQSKD